MSLGDYHVITGPSVLLLGLAWGFELVITTRCIADCVSKTRSCGHARFTNLSEIGRSRYFVQPLGLRFILGYDENRIFLTFLKPIVFGNLRFYGEKKIW